MSDPITREDLKEIYKYIDSSNRQQREHQERHLDKEIKELKELLDVKTKQNNRIIWAMAAAVGGSFTFTMGIIFDIWNKLQDHQNLWAHGGALVGLEELKNRVDILYCQIFEACHFASVIPSPP